MLSITDLKRKANDNYLDLNHIVDHEERITRAVVGAIPEDKKICLKIAAKNELIWKIKMEEGFENIVSWAEFIIQEEMIDYIKTEYREITLQDLELELRNRHCLERDCDESDNDYCMRIIHCIQDILYNNKRPDLECFVRSIYNSNDFNEYKNKLKTVDESKIGDLFAIIDLYLRENTIKI